MVSNQGDAVKIDQSPDNMIVDNWFYATDKASGSELEGNTVANPQLTPDHHVPANSPANGAGASVTDTKTGPDA